MSNVPPIFSQKESIVALAILLVGGYFHYRGKNLSSDNTAMIQQGIGMLFDLVAANVAWFAAKHAQNRDQIKDNAQAVNHNADVLSNVAPAAPVMKVTTGDGKGAQQK